MIRRVEPGRGAGYENQWGFFSPGKGGRWLETQVLSERSSAQDLVLSHSGLCEGKATQNKQIHTDRTKLGGQGRDLEGQPQRCLC